MPSPARCGRGTRYRLGRAAPTRGALSVGLGGAAGERLVASVDPDRIGGDRPGAGPSRPEHRRATRPSATAPPGHRRVNPQVLLHDAGQAEPINDPRRAAPGIAAGLTAASVGTRLAGQDRGMTPPGNGPGRRPTGPGMIILSAIHSPTSPTNHPVAGLCVGAGPIVGARTTNPADGTPPGRGGARAAPAACPPAGSGGCPGDTSWFPRRAGVRSSTLAHSGCG
jgi:hypothetical protein